MLIKQKKDITYCTFCPKLCRFACTVTNAEMRETVTPTTKMNLMHLVREGAIDFTTDVAEIPYHCTGCRLCTAYCKHRTDVAATMIAAREEAVKFGVCPDSIKKFLGKYREFSNPYGEDLSGALATLKQERRINKTAQIIYFPGAVTLQHYPGVATDMVSLLEICGADFAVLGGDYLCCGIPALLAGDRVTFDKVAKLIAEILNSYETVICGDPSAIEVIKTYYPSAGASVKAKLEHTTEWLARQATEKRITFGPKSDQKIIYHDPCYLSKYLNIIEEPRYLLQQMFYPDNILEFSWSRDKNYCCGGGGLVPVTAPEVAAEITRERLKEFYEHAPDALVTACPTCERMFERADNTIAVLDIVTLVKQQIDEIIAGSGSI